MGVGYQLEVGPDTIPLRGQQVQSKATTDEWQGQYLNPDVTSKTKVCAVLSLE